MKFRTGFLALVSHLRKNITFSYWFSDYMCNDSALGFSISKVSAETRCIGLLKAHIYEVPVSLKSIFIMFSI